MSEQRRVAVLGTGIMGAAMARVLRRAGHDVTAWNRTSERAAPLAQAGVRVAGTAQEAVADRDAVITMLFDADTVLEVMGPLAGRLDGAVWLQMSTIGVEGTRRAAALADDAGLTLLDAPVVGTRAPAEKGELVVLVAGDRKAEPVVRPLLDAVGARTDWLDDRPGAATALKLVVNAWVGTLNAAVGQSVALARGLGLDPALFLATIDGAPTGTPYAQLKGRQMIEGDYAVSFGLDNALKDLRLIREAAEAGGVDPALLDGALRLYGTASGLGHGGDDMAAVHEAFGPGSPGEPS
jgi:3-hydroxyisobutyrate dehydrogenase